MGKTLSIKNYERYQHYKDRRPAWIKVYVELLDDYDFLQLEDQQKWHYLGLLLLASKYDNKIPADLEFIKKQIGAKTEISLSPHFLKTHVLAHGKHPASKSLAHCKQNAMPETETETEIDGDASTALPVISPVQRIVDRWNAIPGVKLCKTVEGKLTVRLNALRASKADSWWEDFFAEVAKSKFLTGQTVPTNGRRTFRADLFWATGPENLSKIMSGKYDDSTDRPFDPVMEQARVFLQKGAV